MNESVAVLAALAASVTFGASDVFEQRATHAVQKRHPLDIRLFGDLIRSRLWRIGITVDISGSVLQAIALHFGPLSLVQPILVCNLLFAAVISAAVDRRRPDRVMAAGVLCCTGGLAMFLAVARPQGGAASVSPTIMLPLGAGLAAAIAVCLAAARLSPNKGLPLASAFACGAVFGVTAFLIKEITQIAAHGFSSPSQLWPLYAFIVLEPIGFLLNMDAFQESALVAPVQAILSITDPLVAIGIGLVWLNERIASAPGDIAAELIGLIFMTAGVYALAYRSPQLTAQNSGLPLNSTTVLLATGFAAAITESISMGAVGWTSALSEGDCYGSFGEKDHSERTRGDCTGGPRRGLVRRMPGKLKSLLQRRIYGVNGACVMGV